MGGLFSGLWGKKKGRILVLGLDGAGKTTLLYRLKLGESIHTVPTFGFNVEAVVRDKFELIIWDVGGQDKIRPLWRHYYLDTNAVIFVVDSADSARFPQAKAILHQLCAAQDLRDAPVLVLANKQDLPQAATVEFEATSVGLLELLPAAEWRLEGDEEFDDVSLVVMDEEEGEEARRLAELTKRTVTQALDLSNLPKQRNVKVVGTSALTGQGVEEGIRWLETLM
mmetsp:Transcript_17029/g.41194  ORF Transcript_17029/g.41194 Transcript_17029/m.41194 type:complete len:225 (-) Transcript_17029:436-1110(-)